MNNQTDQELLRECVVHQSDDAFNTLVHRHLDKVYSAALRVVCEDESLAKDVTQDVFRALWTKAPQVMDRSVLSGWLHVTTQFVAYRALRTEARHRAWEKEAAAMIEPYADEPQAAWKQLAPHLDALLVELPETDHDAVMLRFFERKTFPEIAQILGISAQAAQRRVSRGIERLRERFAQRGVTVGTSALGVAIAANAVQAAPAGLAASIAAALGISGGVSAAVTATVATGSVSTATTATTATTNIAMTALKSIVVASLAGLLGVGLFEVRKATVGRAAAEASAQQQASLAEQLRQELEASNRQSASQGEVIRGLLAERAELLRLRGEVGRLQAALDNGARTENPVLNSWLDRNKRLRARVEQTPEAQVPELQLATEQDWLDASKGTLETDMDYRKALSALRHTAEGKLVVPLHAALKRYLAAAAGKVPATVQQLASYFDPPVDPGLLARWKVEPAKDDDVMEVGHFRITQTPVDEALDHLWFVGPDSYGTASVTQQDKTAAILAEVCEAFLASGQALRDPAQLQPFATTAEQRAVVDQWATAFKSMSTEQQAEALRPLQQGR